MPFCGILKRTLRNSPLPFFLSLSGVVYINTKNRQMQGVFLLFFVLLLILFRHAGTRCSGAPAGAAGVYEKPPFPGILPKNNGSSLSGESGI